MNEVQLIRAQLNVERQHAAEVSRACTNAIAGGGSQGPGAQDMGSQDTGSQDTGAPAASSHGAGYPGASASSADALYAAALAAFRQASVDYLVWVLTRFEVREQALRDLCSERFAADDPSRRAMEASLALPGTCRDALKSLAAAIDMNVASDDAASRWMEFHRFFSGAWSARRDEIDRLFGAQAKVIDWRTVSSIDADSIVDERTRYARVKATLPAGVEMTPGASRLSQ